MLSPNGQNGLTLVEVLIAMTIMAVLATFTADSVTRSLKMKAKIQKDLYSESRLRNAIRVIERDINLAFHYQNFDYDLRQAVKKNLASGANPPTGPITPGPDSAAEDEDLKPPKVLTGFVGEPATLNFTALSHVRLSADAKESDQEEVAYHVATCPDSPLFQGSGLTATNCLFRRSTPYLDGDLETGGAETALISNVKKFALRYLGKGKQDWVDVWRSDDLGDDASKGNFPDAVEVTLEVDFQGKPISISTVVPLRFPNNPKGDAGGATKKTTP